MAFLDGVNKQIKNVKSSAQRAADLTRTQRRVHSMMQEVEKVYTQIGKSYYTSLRDGGANLDALQQMCAMVDTLERDIAALLKQTDELKNLRRCPQCGNTQSLGSKFCSVCGYKFPDEPTPPAATNDTADVSEAPESGDAAEPQEAGGNVYINWPQGAPAESDGEAEEEPEETEPEPPKKGKK